MIPPSPHQYYAYEFTPCCDSSTPLYFLDTSSISSEGVFEYIGLVPYVDGNGNYLMPGMCYYITIVPIGSAIVMGPPSASDLSFVSKDPCDPENIPEGCGSCNPACYYLIPCVDSPNTDPFYSNTPELSGYLNQFVNIFYDEQSFCVYVTEGDPTRCATAAPVVINEETTCTECALTCYYISNVSSLVYYVDADMVLQTLSAANAKPYVQICSYIEPITFVASSTVIHNLGPCTEDGCPAKCFELKSCDQSEVFYSTSQNLIQHWANNSIVKLSGYDGCYEVGLSNITCDCPVEVTVTQVFENCLACEGYKNYKLTNCESNAVKYTSNDLSAYVGDVVEISENSVACPGCWRVELFTFPITSNINIAVINTFKDCKECLQDYWLLEDCAQIEADIITITDLSIFEDEYIRLTWCPDTCWHVTSTRQHTNPTIVFLENNYVDCQTCIIDALPCICVSLKNTSMGPYTLEYYDCDGNGQEIIINANELTDKMCIKQLVNPPEFITVNNFGNCSGTSPDYTCPIVPTPRRAVTPGFNTPNCSPEYYERVFCHFSAWIYGEVLKQRYGISPCCSEEAEKWEIKQQMLEYSAAYNPDYACTPASTCCGSCGSTTSSCNCK